jgi:hypothetical protein
MRGIRDWREEKRIPTTPLEKGGKENLAPLFKGGRGDSDMCRKIKESIW